MRWEKREQKEEDEDGKGERLCWWLVVMVVCVCVCLFVCVYVCVCKRGLRQDASSTIDSHRGTLMTHILLHSAGEAPCITSAPYSCPCYTPLFSCFPAPLCLSHTHTVVLRLWNRTKAICRYFSQRHSSAPSLTSWLIINERSNVWLWVGCTSIIHVGVYVGNAILNASTSLHPCQSVWS